ncbi:MAG TPA: S1C family serine protease [Acidobacteriota bacterium]|nr:S1C family serine protease [Acidobacteriota bacterium]
MQHDSTMTSTWQTLSIESANIIEKVGRVVVAVYGRRRIPSSGVQWRPGIVVTADHALERDEEISVTLPDGQGVMAALVGRDPSTDLAIIKSDSVNLPIPEFGDIRALKVGNWILAAGRTAEGGARAGLALAGVVGGAWRTWRGGLLDHTLRLDRNLHPNFSGGPAADDRGRILGIITAGLSRYAAVVIPASTVERVTEELAKRGHIGRGYLGVAMQPVRLPLKIREALRLGSDSGVLIVSVEPGSPADKAGVILGDVFVAINSNAIEDVDDLQDHLAGELIGSSMKVSLLRGGAPAEVVITIGERPRSS